MNKAAKITSLQLALLTAGSALMFPYTFLPILRIPPANQDVWLSLVMAIPYFIVINAPLLYLANKFKGFDFNEINDRIMGKTLGKVTVSLFFIFVLFCFTICGIMAVNYITMFLLIDTPRWAVLLFVLAPITYASYKGAGVIGRLAVFLIPFMLLMIVFFFFLGIPHMDVTQILPVFSDSTFKQLNIGAFLTAARFSEIILLIVFSFHLKTGEKINKAFFIGIGVFLIAFFLILLPVLLTLGVEYAKLANNPFYAYTRQIGGQDIFQRVQVFNILSWFVGITIKLIGYSYVASFILSRLFKRPSHTKMVIPISIVVFILALIPFLVKMTTIHYIAEYIMPRGVFVLIFILPVIFTVVYMIRKKKIDAQITERQNSIQQIIERENQEHKTEQDERKKEKQNN